MARSTSARLPRLSLFALLTVSCVALCFFAAITPAGAQCYVTMPNPGSRLDPPLLPTPLPEVGPHAIEQRWGVRILRLAGGADGSRVELSLQVLAPSRAQALASAPQNLLGLIDMDRGIRLQPRIPAQPLLLQRGEVWTLVFHPERTLRRGSLVTVAIGDLRLHPLPIQ